MEQLIHLSTTSEPRAAIVHKVSHSPKTMKNVTRPLIKTHGGKFYLSAAFLEIIGKRFAEAKYVKELFGGGANFLIQSPRASGYEVYNDIDPLTANVYRVAADPRLSPRLLDRLAAVKCSNREEMEKEFNDACFVVKTADNFIASGRLNLWEPFTPAETLVGTALAFIVNRRMSRGGLGGSFAWSDRERGGQPGDINSWQTFVANHAPRVCFRARNWICVSRPAIGLLDPETAPDDGVNDAESAFYLDPPYLPETRTVKKAYRQEMTYDEHEALLLRIVDAKAAVAISGYANRLYGSHLTTERGWKVHYFSLPNNSGQGKEKRRMIEALWTNF